VSRKLLAVDRHFNSLHLSCYECKNAATFLYCIVSTVIITEIRYFCYQLPHIKQNSFRDTCFTTKTTLAWAALWYNTE